MTASVSTNTHALHSPRQAPRLSRNAAIALVVVALHVGLLAALQSGLLMRAAEIVVPAEMLVQLIEPSPPKAEPPPAAPLPEPPQKKTAPVQAAPAPAPKPRAVEKAEPAPSAPAGVVNAPVEPAPITAVPAPATAAPPAPLAPPAPPAPPVVQSPSSDADYLQNPKPQYPENSERLGEQGTSTIRVLIGTDGVPQKAEIGQSSGFNRLDRAALATVLRWRFVPGKRNGVPEAMWFSVPIVWKLTNQ
jgi:periplasmic protein TonB